MTPLALVWLACRSAPVGGGGAGPVDGSTWDSTASAATAATSATGGGHTGDTTAPTLDGDGDGDGHLPPEDCDDADAAVFPGAADPPGDQLDSDCDGVDGHAGAYAEGPWALGEFGWSIAVADIDDDGRDEVASGAAATSWWAYDDEVEAGAVLLFDEDLRRQALLHGPPGGSLGVTVAVVDGQSEPLVATHTLETNPLGGETYLLAPSAWGDDGELAAHVASDVMPGVHGELSVRGLHSVAGQLWASAVSPGADGAWAVLEADLPSAGRSWADATVLTRDEPGEALGLALASDGVGVAMGQSTWDEARGRAHWYPSKPVGETPASALHTWSGAHPSAYFGIAMALLVDSELDRRLVVVGAAGDDSDRARGGRVYVFDPQNVPDSPPLATIHGDRDGGFLGWAIHAPGDVNGDGHDDLLVGAPGDRASDAVAGRAYLFTGPLRGEITTVDAAWVFYGTQPGDETGSGLASGDFDGDGEVDLLIGRRGYEPPGMPFAGRIDRVLNTEIVW